MFAWIGQIKALLKIKSEVKSMSFSEIRTSEGRLHLIGQIMVIYGAIHGFIPVPIATTIALWAFGIYTASRAIVKAAEALSGLTKSTRDDAIVAEAAKILDAVAPKP